MLYEYCINHMNHILQLMYSQNMKHIKNIMNSLMTFDFMSCFDLLAQVHWTAEVEEAIEGKARHFNS